MKITTKFVRLGQKLSFFLVEIFREFGENRVFLLKNILKILQNTSFLRVFYCKCLYCKYFFVFLH